MRFSVHTCTEGMNYVPNENKTYKPRKNIIAEHTIPLLLNMEINVAPYFISEIDRFTPLGTPLNNPPSSRTHVLTSLHLRISYPTKHTYQS